MLQLKQAGYLTTGEVAQALGIGVTTLRRREGTIYPQAVRIGGIRVYHEGTSTCSDAGTRCRQQQPAGNSPGAADAERRPGYREHDQPPTTSFLTCCLSQEPRRVAM
jgi:hypothetical protein